MGSIAPPIARGATIIDDQTLAELESDESARKAGDKGFPTDSLYVLDCRSDGVWTYLFQSIVCKKPPSTGWTPYNSGAVVDMGGIRVNTIPGELFVGWRGEYRTQFADPVVTPFFTEFILATAWLGGGASGTGPNFWGFSDGTGIALGNQGGNFQSVSRYSAANSFVGSDVTVVVNTFAFPLRVRIEQDATERHFFINNAGLQSDEMGAGFNRTTTFTSSEVIWGGGGYDVELPRSIALVSFEEGPL